MAGRPTKKHAGGRPTKMTLETIGKLEEAFAVDATYEEASIYADINPDTLYEYIKKNPEFSDRIKRLKGMTGLRAKININKSINDGNGYDSKWWLERRDKEFKNVSKQEVTIGAHKSLIDAILESKKGRKGKC